MSKYVALDIETTGLDYYRDKITCIGVSDGTGGERVYRDVARFTDDVRSGWLAGKTFVLHNYAFDYSFLIRAGVFTLDNLPPCEDTRLAFHSYNVKVPKGFLEAYEEQRKLENQKLPPGVSHRAARGTSLKVLAPYFLKVQAFWENPAQHDDDEYVLKDCNYTLALFNYVMPRLNDKEKAFYRKLMEWQGMLLRMEQRGIRLDLEELAVVEAEYKAKEQEAESRVRAAWSEHLQAYEQMQISEINAKYDEMTKKALERAKDKAKCIVRYDKLRNAALNKVENFNFASNSQMLWLLRDRLKYDVTTLSGDESTRKSVLNALAAKGHKDVEDYLAWRDANKVLTMYVPTYRDLAVNGTIHASFNLTGTRTGRLSSSRPNCQQVPSKLYRVFKPRTEHKFIQYDLGGIEAALIALYSGDPMLYEIVSTGSSVHNYNAKAFFSLNCDPSEVPEKYPAERRAAKTVGFALLYGARWRRIKEAFATAGFHITDQEAQEKYENYREYYRQAFEFHEMVTDVLESGEVIYNLLGRPIQASSMNNIYMQGFNTLVQSSASDLNVEACYRTMKECDERGLRAAPLLLVHDMTMFEAHENDVAEVDKLLTKHMVGFNLKNDLGPVPLTIEGGISDVWQK